MPKLLKKYSLLGALMLGAVVLAGCTHERFLGGTTPETTSEESMEAESMMEGDAMEAEDGMMEEEAMEGEAMEEESMEKEGEAMEGGAMMEGETKLEVESMEVMEK